MASFATATRNAMLDAIAAKVDADASAGYVEVRTGAKPANANTAASGTLLVTITLDDPAFTGAAAAGVLTVDVSSNPTGAAVADGDAGWARVYDGADNSVFDATVSDSGGSGELIISSETITTGQDVELVATTLTLPA